MVGKETAASGETERKDDGRKLFAKALRIAWPSVMESFFVTLAGVIDTMMVSTLGSAAVAAVGLTVQPKFIGLSIFFAINVALSAIVARRKGEGKKDGANAVFLTSLVITVALCAAVSFLCVLLANPIITISGSSQDTHLDAVIYFRIIMGGMFFNVLTMVINAAQRGCGNTQIAMTTNVTSSIVNIFFNYLLIGGHFGFPALGIQGAAIATVLGTVVSSIMSVCSVMKKDGFISFFFIIKEKIKPSIDAVRSILKLAPNLFAENIMMRIGFLATSMIAARLGTDEFAAHQVGMNLLGLAFSFADGMQVAAVALTGESLGEGNKKRAFRYGNICQKIGLFISACLSVTLFFGGRFIFSLFFNDAHILDMGVMISRVVMIIVLAQISQIIYGGCLRAAGDVKYTLIASIVSVTIIRTFMTIFLTSVLGMGLLGVWLGVLSDQISRFLFMSIRFYRGKWTELKL